MARTKKKSKSRRKPKVKARAKAKVLKKAKTIAKTKAGKKVQRRPAKKPVARVNRRAVMKATHTKVYPVASAIAKRAHIDLKKYKAMYERSVKNPDGFWAEQAKQFVSWSKPWTKVSDWSFDAKNLHIQWFIDGKLNVSYNCLDRHLATRGDQVAILWEGDDPKDDRTITYRALHAEVCRLANVLKNRGVKKGDRVCLYMPMVPAAAVAMLACTRIGAVHSVVFGGFSPTSLSDRILDSDCRVVITADEGVRAGKKIPLKANTDSALEKCPNVHTVVVYQRTGAAVAMKAGRDIVYQDEIA